MSKRFVLLLAVSLAVVAQGCRSKTAGVAADAAAGGPVVVKGAADSTAPVVSLKLADPATNVRIVLESGGPDRTVTMKAAQSFPLTAAAEDAEGVRELRLVPLPEVSGVHYAGPQDPAGPPVECQPDPGYRPPDPGATPYKATSRAAKPGDAAETRLSILYQVSGHKPGAGGGCVATYVWKIHAEADNFSGLTGRSPTLTIIEQPE